MVARWRSAILSERPGRVSWRRRLRVGRRGGGKGLASICSAGGKATHGASRGVDDDDGEERRNDADNPAWIAPPPLIYAGAGPPVFWRTGCTLFPSYRMASRGRRLAFDLRRVGDRTLAFERWNGPRTNVTPTAHDRHSRRRSFRYTRNPLYGGDDFDVRRCLGPR